MKLETLWTGTRNSLHRGRPGREDRLGSVVSCSRKDTVRNIQKKIDEQRCNTVLKTCKIISDLEESKAKITQNKFKGKIL